MEVHSNIVALLKQKIHEPKEKTPMLETVHARELVDDSISSVSKSVLSPMEAPQEHLVYSREAVEEDTLPTYPAFLKKTLSNTQPTKPASLASLDIPDIDKVDVSNVFLVNQSTQHVHLVHQDGFYLFPVLAQDATPEEAEKLSKKHNGVIHWEPNLHSAYIVVEKEHGTYLKSTVIQQKTIGTVPVHPSVWGFYGLYPEYIPTTFVYSMVRLEDDTYMRGDLTELMEQYPMYVLEEDARRFEIDGTREARDMREVGYLEYGMSLERKIDNFIKEFNTIQYLCIRLPVKHRILPIWILLESE